MQLQNKSSLILLVTALGVRKRAIKAAAIPDAIKIAASMEKNMHNREHRQQ
jgi:hypothetical protein